MSKSCPTCGTRHISIWRVNSRGDLLHRTNGVETIWDHLPRWFVIFIHQLVISAIETFECQDKTLSWDVNHGMRMKHNLKWCCVTFAGLNVHAPRCIHCNGLFIGQWQLNSIFRFIAIVNEHYISVSVYFITIMTISMLLCSWFGMQVSSIFLHELTHFHPTRAFSSRGQKLQNNTSMLIQWHIYRSQSIYI